MADENQIRLELNYSDRSFVLRGLDTKNIKEELLKIGCKYSSILTKGERKGWICSNRNLDAVVKLVLRNGGVIIEDGKDVTNRYGQAMSPIQSKTPQGAQPPSRINARQTVRTGMSAKAFEELSDFEIMNLVRPDTDKQSMYELKLQALDKLSADKKLDNKFDQSIVNETFGTFYTMSDYDLVKKLNELGFEYIPGLTHMGAAILAAYVADSEFPQIGIEIINELTPGFDISRYVS